jgi:dTDP-4-amino-4,6-dideoxygalactose transaminase
MIPLLDLRAQHNQIGAEVEAAAVRVLRSGRYVLGPEVEGFEAELAALCGTRHAIGVNSGTSALHLSLLGLGVGPGDEVITVAFTFVATAAAIMYTGARPTLVDINDETLTMDPARLEAAITPRTKAIIPVHLHGQTADMDQILAIAARHRIPVVEDACQAHGALDKGRRAGAMGVAGCFSFYPGKNLGAAGEGGAITTDDDALAHRLRLLRDWGAEHKYDHQMLAFNYRLEAIQAAVLRVKLARLEEWTAARREVAAGYREALRELPPSEVRATAEREGAGHVYHVFALRTPRRDALQAALAEDGVQTGIHYPTPVHLQPGYASLGYGRGDFPVSERAAAEELSLPIYPEMTAAQREHVMTALARALQPA